MPTLRAARSLELPIHIASPPPEVSHTRVLTRNLHRLLGGIRHPLRKPLAVNRDIIHDAAHESLRTLPRRVRQHLSRVPRRAFRVDMFYCTAINGCAATACRNNHVNPPRYTSPTVIINANCASRGQCPHHRLTA